MTIRLAISKKTPKTWWHPLLKSKKSLCFVLIDFCKNTYIYIHLLSFPYCFFPVFHRYGMLFLYSSNQNLQSKAHSKLNRIFLLLVFLGYRQLSLDWSGITGRAHYIHCGLAQKDEVPESNMYNQEMYTCYCRLPNPRLE